MDYVTVTSSFLPQNKKRKKLCVHNKKYNNDKYTNVSKMKCILPSPLSIAFNRIPFSSYSIFQHFSPTSPFPFLQQKESCGRVMYFILLTLYCLLPFGKYFLMKSFYFEMEYFQTTSRKVNDWIISI